MTGEIGNPARLSCVISIETAGTQVTFTDAEIEELGGVPQYWLNDSELVVSYNLCSDLCDSDAVTGVYNTVTKQYRTLLEYTSRSLYCEQKWVGMDYLSQKLVLLMGDWNNGTSTLYELNYSGTMEQFIDSQLSSQQYCELDLEIESVPSELSKIGEIPHCSWSQLTKIGIDKEANTGAYLLNFQGCEDGDTYTYNPTTRNLEVLEM